jgi:uncharacterized protein (DUF983 family)
MNATIDVRIDCPWCGQGLLIAEPTTALVARCDDCSTTVDLADPAPAQVSRHHLPAVAAA